MREPVVLYSIQTYLAYHINKEYYSDIHYVWCAPCFDSRVLARTEPQLPITSNPRDIFNSFVCDVYAKDHHYLRQSIDTNIAGLIAGAEAKYSTGVITDATKKKIVGLIRFINDKRDFHYFRPLIYVIPYQKIQSRVSLVDYDKIALPLSPEYLIVDLSTTEFDIIDFDKEVLL